MIHSFKDSLAKGIEGERLIETFMPNLIRLAGRKADFADIGTGELYELKTDSYCMEKTPNFFIELWSDVDAGKPGGPAQALEHGSKYWMYLFSKQGILFVFETEALVEWLKTAAQTYPWKYIKNRSWTTVGIAVPRTALYSLYKEMRLK